MLGRGVGRADGCGSRVLSACLWRARRSSSWGSAGFESVPPSSMLVSRGSRNPLARIPGSRQTSKTVNDLVHVFGMAQPQVSKHLRVLREVGAVDVRDAGRQRLYRLNGRALKPIHDWVKTYERSWSERFDQLDVVLEELEQKEERDGGSGG